MPGGQSLADGFQAQSGVIELPRYQRFRKRVAVPMGQVQHAKGQQGRSPVGGHIGQPYRHDRMGLVSSQPQANHGDAHDPNRSLQRGGIKTQRPRIIFALIRRPFGGNPALTVGAPFLRLHARGLGRTDLLGRSWHRHIGQVSPGQVQPPGHNLRRRPVRQAQPMPGPVFKQRLRGGIVHHIQPQLRISLNPGVDTLQPTVPPAFAFVQKVDGGAGYPGVWLFVAPRTNQGLAWGRQVFQHRKDRRGIAVEPAADQQCSRRDGRIILADRPLFPERIAALMAQPFGRIQPQIGDSVLPHAPPAVRPHHRRIGGQGPAIQERTAPAEIVVQQASAQIMRITAIAVIGRTDGDHRLQRRGTASGDLQAVETTP